MGSPSWNAGSSLFFRCIPESVSIITPFFQHSLPCRKAVQQGSGTGTGTGTGTGIIIDLSRSREQAHRISVFVGNFVKRRVMLALTRLIRQSRFSVLAAGPKLRGVS